LRSLHPRGSSAIRLPLLSHFHYIFFIVLLYISSDFHMSLRFTEKADEAYFIGFYLSQ